MKKAIIILQSILGLILFFGFSQITQAQQNVTRTLPQPGYYNLQVGDLRVVVLSDGTNPLEMDKLLLNARPGQLQAAFQQNFQSTTVEASDNVFLVTTGGKNILVDAGCGDLLGTSFGQLLKSLRNAGFQPDHIDAVLLTHLHPDHCGGLMRDGKLAFPNAVVYVEKAESDFWLSEEHLKTAPAAYKPYFEYAQNSVLPYARAGKVKTFKPGDELFPGVTAWGTAGHTPGHTSYLIESNGEKLLILGDLIHAAAVQFADPGIAISFDNDPQEAINTRRKIFDDAANGKYLIAGEHLSFPGLGHLRTDGKGYVFVPVNYATIIK